MDQTEEEKDRRFEEIKNSKWKQNEVYNIRFKPTLLSTTITFFVFGAAFIVLGSIVTYSSNHLLEEKIEYTKCNKDFCRYSFTVNEYTKGPFIFAYELNGFYQNMRNYIISRSDDQLHGKKVSLDELNKGKLCEGGKTNKEMGLLKSFNGSDLDPDAVAIPCGIMAKTYFNDTFEIYGPDGKRVKINENNIAWKSDKDLFKNVDAGSWQKYQWIDMTDEHFIVWMRPSAFAYFRKLWGTIDDDLAEGEYSVRIANNYDVNSFNGKKFVVITNLKSTGGKNYSLGVSYLVVGVACVLISIGIFFGYNLYKRRKNQGGDNEDDQVEDHEIF